MLFDHYKIYNSPGTAIEHQTDVFQSWRMNFAAAVQSGIPPTHHVQTSDLYPHKVFIVRVLCVLCYVSMHTQYRCTTEPFFNFPVLRAKWQRNS